MIVLDENDHAPEFTSPLYEGRITENSPPGTKVNLSIPITATDKDEGINQNFVFTLHGEGSELFRIHPTTGLVYFEGIDDRTLDREARANYSFTIVAKDNGKTSFLEELEFIQTASACIYKYTRCKCKDNNSFEFHYVKYIIEYKIKKKF